MSDAMAVNNAEFRVIKFLGKGKGGYSYLVTDGAAQYVLKQIHHEPCEYYAFGDKLRSELRDYETLRKLGIPMPRLLAVDTRQERILKEYIAGQTIAEQLKEGRMEPDWLTQVQAMCSLLYPAGLNIDYYPTNFVPCDGMLYYIDYECNPIWSNGTLNIGEVSIGRCRHPKEQIKHRISKRNVMEKTLYETKIKISNRTPFSDLLDAVYRHRLCGGSAGNAH